MESKKMKNAAIVLLAIMVIFLAVFASKMYESQRYENREDSVTRVKRTSDGPRKWSSLRSESISWTSGHISVPFHIKESGTVRFKVSHYDSRRMGKNQLTQIGTVDIMTATAYGKWSSWSSDHNFNPIASFHSYLSYADSVENSGFLLPGEYYLVVRGSKGSARYGRDIQISVEKHSPR